MFSKRLVNVILAALFTIVQAGCGLKTGEKAPDMAPPSFSGKGYSCVGQIPQHLERYAWDQLNDGQITDFVHCLQNAFTTFVHLTRGKDKETYTPDEIRRFLQAYFLRERPITDRLLQEFMVLKQLLVGGEVDIITRPEIKELIEFLEDVRREAIRIRPFIKYLNPSLILTQDPRDIGQRLTEANETLRQSIRVITLRLQGGQKNYSFDNLTVLMAEFRNFVRWDDHFRNSRPVDAWVEFFRQFKRTAVTTNNPEEMRMADWAPFLQTFSRWYLAYIRFRVGVKDQPILQGVGLQNFMGLGQEVFELAEEAVHRQPNKVMSLEQINALISSAQALNWLPGKLRAQSVERFAHALVDRMFADENAVPGRNRANGLTLPALSLMKYEFFRWAYIQREIEQRYVPNKTQIESGRVPNLQSTFLMPTEIGVKIRKDRDANWENFYKVRGMIRPLFNENLKRVTLVNEADFGRYRLVNEFHNLSMMNVLRSSVGLLFRGYAQLPGKRWDWMSGIKSEQLQTFYEDFRDLAVDLGLADPRVSNTGARAFIEGNLFTYSADGVNFDVSKSRLTFVEAMELLAFIYSGGRMATETYQRLKTVCRNGPNDINGDATLDRICVQQRLVDAIVEFAPNLPGMNDYVRSAPPAERELLVKNILDSAFSPRFSKIEWVERSELAIMAVVLHYLEAVLTRYDVSRDGILTTDELRKAVPIFSGFIQRYAKDRLKKELSVREAEGVFLFILAYRTFPTSWNSIRIWYLSYQWPQWELEFPWGIKVPINPNQNINLNRADLSSVFRVIVAKLFDTAPVAEQIRVLNRLPGPAACQTVEEFQAGGCVLPGSEK